jgi:molecular chaperone DnaJ
MATRPKRDYYAVLGVARSADRETIRRAFRSLVSEWHPDVSDDPEAPERFREIAEAYEILSRPDARRRYDRYGFDPRGVGGFEPGSAGGQELFDDIADLLQSFARPGRRGGDVRVELEVDGAEALRGARKPVRYRALTECRACGGEGGMPGSAQVRCGDCDGRGRVRDAGEGGRPAHLRVCRRCRGAGRVPDPPCGQCDGAGRFDAERALLVDIPAGTADGDEVRVAGEGNAGGTGAAPGDVVVAIRLRPAPDPRRFRLVAAAGSLLAAGLIVLVVVLLTT